VTVAASTNRRGTVTVRATNQGMPVEVKIDREELRYGAGPLAAEVLRLCKIAAAQAGARRRDLLAARGLTDELLNALRLPTRAQALATDKDPDESFTPQTWMRKV
jgi:hypothetical protein